MAKMPVWSVILLVVASIVGFAAFILLLRRWMQGRKYTKPTLIDDKVVLITGGNTGIGKETAIELAKRHGKVYIACRDAKRGEEALQEIMYKSGSTNVHLMILDLASLESVREFSKNFHEVESELHILINNAGVMACPKLLTKDGFELQFGVNHLGHFLLTNLLLDLIKKSSPSRVVTVSSSIYRLGIIQKEDLQSEKSYHRWEAYSQSKLANILFTRELARRLTGTGVTANSLHPGAVSTELLRHISPILACFFAPLKWILFRTARNGAQTQIRLALDPDLNGVSGKYFDNGREIAPRRRARDDATAQWLWKKSEELVGLSGSTIV